MNRPLCFALLVFFLVPCACGGDAADAADGGSDSVALAQDTGPWVDEGEVSLDTSPPPEFPKAPNEVEFLLENHTEEVITIKMHGTTITPGWFEILDGAQSLKIFEECSLCSCDEDPATSDCAECPDLKPNYSEVNPGGLVSRYWPGTVFTIEDPLGEICEGEEIVPVNDLVARFCWWSGPKEIAPDAEQTCVELSFKAWEEIQVNHQVK